MLRITVDVFSGRENPYAYLEGDEAREFLAQVSRQRSVVTSVAAGEQGLGFRGVIVEAMDDDTVERYGLPSAFKIAGGASANEAKAQELAEPLVQHVAKAGARDGLVYASGFDRQLLDLMRLLPAHAHHAAKDGDSAAAAAAGPCTIELGAFNPGFWNDPNYIYRNNCYNYASNKRTNTFAQPGRGSGQMYTSLTCAAVTNAALSDGLHHRFDCFPDTERPRWLVALVVAPGFDYHWYRLQREGFWGHKPGGTAARNYDNNGVVIINPETCARAPYTNFCGYFYVPASQRIA